MTTGEYCDAAANNGTGACKCSESVPACTNGNEVCDNIYHVCKCGSADSCEGKVTGSYCDSANSKCKCSATQDACADGTHKCENGMCIGKF